jgi:hypothetical protein
MKSGDTVWVASFGLDKNRIWAMSPPVFGTTTIVKVTKAQVQVVSNQFTGYKERLGKDEVFETREQMVEGIRKKVLNCAEYHEKVAAAFRKTVE